MKRHGFTILILLVSIARRPGRRDHGEPVRDSPAQRAITSKGSERQVLKSGYYPQIELIGRHPQDGEDPGARTNAHANPYNASVGIPASWDIFTFGKTRSRITVAAAEQRALKQTLEKIRDDMWS